MINSIYESQIGLEFYDSKFRCCKDFLQHLYFLISNWWKMQTCITCLVFTFSIHAELACVACDRWKGQSECWAHHHYHHIRLTSVTSKHTSVFHASALASGGAPSHISPSFNGPVRLHPLYPWAVRSLLTQLLHVFLGAPLSTTAGSHGVLKNFFTQLWNVTFAQHAQTILTFLSVSWCQHISIIKRNQKFINSLSIF